MHQGWQRLAARLPPTRGRRGGSSEDEPEVVVSRFFTSYSAAGRSWGARLLEQAPRALAASRAARSLPVLSVDVSDADEGRVIRRGLSHLGRRTYKTGFLRTPLHEVASVLILPRAPQQYADGSSKQTLRRKSRAAERAGVRWVAVDDVAERRRLVALSQTRERDHPQERYRSADVDNTRLLDFRLWLVAYSAEDVPLLMAVVPTDGEWSMLAYFRTLEDSTTASNARYLMSWVLAEALVERGVRYLVDTATMSNLPDGLRHFQHMLGYQVVRVRFPPARRRTRPAPHLPTGIPARSLDRGPELDPVAGGGTGAGSGNAHPAPAETARA